MRSLELNFSGCPSIIFRHKNISGILSIECYHCSGKIEYCNKTRTTKTCQGSHFSCLLRFGSTEVWMIKNGKLVSEIQDRVSKTCAVESRSYCEDQKKIDPNLKYCKVRISRFKSDLQLRREPTRLHFEGEIYKHLKQKLQPFKVGPL